jgi:hypothetical protein
MSDYCGRFYFAKDMNGDFIFTITDVSLMLEFFYLLPAKVAVGMIASVPNLTRFFELDCSTGESWGGGMFSLFVWFVILGIFRAVAEGR